jgi:hypothetical protein
MRWRAASTLALLYMLCVLAAPAAFAFGDGSRAAHCLTDNNHGIQSVYAHEHGLHQHDGGKPHVHENGTSHEYSKAPEGGNPEGQCCGLVCLSALPAAFLDVETPAPLMMITVAANQEDVAGNGPDRLYRPPIAPLSL